MSDIKVEIGIPETLFIVFLILKLCKVIDWSWWWITSPIWILIILAIVGTVFNLYRPTKKKMITIRIKRPLLNKKDTENKEND